MFLITRTCFWLREHGEMKKFIHAGAGKILYLMNQFRQFRLSDLAANRCRRTPPSWISLGVAWSSLPQAWIRPGWPPPSYNKLEVTGSPRLAATGYLYWLILIFREWKIWTVLRDNPNTAVGMKFFLLQAYKLFSI